MFDSWGVPSGSITQYTLVARDISSPSDVVAAGSTSAITPGDVLGIAIGTTGTSPMQVARYGIAACVVDSGYYGSAKAGDIAVMGSVVSSDCADYNQVDIAQVPIGMRVVGYFLENASAGNLAPVVLTPGLMGTMLGSTSAPVPLIASSVTATSISTTNNVTAGYGTSILGCVHLRDTATPTSHDMGVCASSTPGSNGLLDLPATGPFAVNFTEAWSFTYNSGAGSANLSAGQTCTLTYTNGAGSGATAIITALATIPSGTTVLNPANVIVLSATPGYGYSYSSPPTTATISSGGPFPGGTGCVPTGLSGAGTVVGGVQLESGMLAVFGADSAGNQQTGWTSFGVPGTGDALDSYSVGGLYLGGSIYLQPQANPTSIGSNTYYGGNIKIGSQGAIGFTEAWSGLAPFEAGFTKVGNGVVGVTHTGTAADTGGIIAANGFEGGASHTPSVLGSGCTATLGTGSTNIAGTFTVSATSCSVTLTQTGVGTVHFSHGMACALSDQTHPTNLWSQTGSTTTTFGATGSATAGDTISYLCMGY